MTFADFFVNPRKKELTQFFEKDFELVLDK